MEDLVAFFVNCQNFELLHEDTKRSCMGLLPRNRFFQSKMDILDCNQQVVENFDLDFVEITLLVLFCDRLSNLTNQR